MRLAIFAQPARVTGRLTDAVIIDCNSSHLMYVMLPKTQNNVNSMRVKDRSNRKVFNSRQWTTVIPQRLRRQAVPDGLAHQLKKTLPPTVQSFMIALWNVSPKSNFRPRGTCGLCTVLLIPCAHC